MAWQSSAVPRWRTRAPRGCGLAHARLAPWSWRARRWGTARSALGRRTGAVRCLALPTRTCVEILRSALQLLCHRQVQHTKPNTTSAHRKRWTQRQTSARLPARSVQRAHAAHTLRPRLPHNAQGALT